jgi:hypothetical protein
LTQFTWKNTQHLFLRWSVPLIRSVWVGEISHDPSIVGISSCYFRLFSVVKIYISDASLTCIWVADIHSVIEQLWDQQMVVQFNQRCDASCDKSMILSSLFNIRSFLQLSLLWALRSSVFYVVLSRCTLIKVVRNRWS